MKTIATIVIWSAFAINASAGAAPIPEIILKMSPSEIGKGLLETSQNTDSTKKKEPTKQELRLTYRSDKNGKFYLDFNLTPSITGRKLRITTAPFPDYPGFDTREQNEYTTFGLSGEAKAGFGLTENSSLYLGYFFQNQGFRTRGHAIDWSTGLADPNAAGNYRYFFRNDGLTFGFSRNPLKKTNNVTADIGFYFVRISPTSGAAKKDPFSRKFGWGNVVSLGYKRIISNHLDFRLMPALHINFTHINHEGLVNTRLFNMGITGGLRWYW